MVAWGTAAATFFSGLGGLSLAAIGGLINQRAHCGSKSAQPARDAGMPDAVEGQPGVETLAAGPRPRHRGRRWRSTLAHKRSRAQEK